MRIPLVSGFRFKHALIFATILFVVQMVERTNVAFAALTSAFILLSTIAFNTAGGFVYPSGWFIFSSATLTAIFGLFLKALLGERGDSHLRAPNLTILVYCAAMALTIPVAWLSRKLRPRKGLLAGMGFGEDMKKASVGALLLGAGFQILTFTVQENGSLLSALRQINFFSQMAIMLSAFYEIKKSNGAKSTNWVVWVAGITTFVAGGLLGFSKQGMLTSIVTWLVTAMVAGYNFRRKQVVIVVGFFVLFQLYLVPYSQVGRNLRTQDPAFADDVKTAVSILPNVAELRRQYLQDQRDAAVDDSRPHLYDNPEGFFDRVTVLAPDDALIAYTADGNEEGLLPTWWALLNVVPHFIWADKPFFFTGNYYAREIGMIAEDNDATGVSFSPAADAFHQASFFGLALLVPPIFLLLFLVMDSLSGDVRTAPWGILFCVTVAHSAPEGILAGQIYVATYVAFGVTTIALLSKYVLPVLSRVITNSERTRVRRTVDFKPELIARSRPAALNTNPAGESS